MLGGCKWLSKGGKKAKYPKATATNKVNRNSDMPGSKETFTELNSLISGWFNPKAHRELTINIPKNYEEVITSTKSFNTIKVFKNKQQQFTCRYITGMTKTADPLGNWKIIHDGLEFIDLCEDLSADNQFIEDQGNNVLVSNFSYSFIENTDTIFGYTYYIVNYPNFTSLDFESTSADSAKHFARINIHDFVSFN
jgi:hypothetical protein